MQKFSKIQILLPSSPVTISRSSSTLRSLFHYNSRRHSVGSLLSQSFDHSFFLIFNLFIFHRLLSAIIHHRDLKLPVILSQERECYKQVWAILYCFPATFRDFTYSISKDIAQKCGAVSVIFSVKDSTMFDHTGISICSLNKSWKCWFDHKIDSIHLRFWHSNALGFDNLKRISITASKLNENQLYSTYISSGTWFSRSARSKRGIRY